MGKRGQPPKPTALKVLTGTDRPDRRTQRTVNTIEGEIEAPPWLSIKARKFFIERAEVLKLRGIELKGCEPMLAQYAALYVSLVEQWETGETPQKGLLDTLKSYAVQFYDVPGSQFVKSPKGKTNPFANNGKRSSHG